MARARGRDGIYWVALASLLGELALSPSMAFAGQYERAVSSLAQASYAYIKVAYACRDILGSARYQEARIAVENAMRATGVPTNVAMSAAARITSGAKSSTSPRKKGDLSRCVVDYFETKRRMVGWRAKVNAIGR